MRDAKQILAEALKKLENRIPGEKEIDSLFGYALLLIKWNRIYNLTAATDIESIIVSHLLDSLSIKPYLKGLRILDIGSGAGLPGIPLAIGLSGAEFVLLDSNGKKTRFMQQAAMELGLGNVRVEKCRIEEYRPELPFDTVISRAFSNLSEFVEVSRGLCNSAGQILAMKGRHPRDEIQAADLEGFSVEVQPLDVPGLNAERHVVCIKPNSK